MATITDLNTNDSGAVSRVTINDNFDNLNIDKQEILSEGAFVDGDKTKLNGIETAADVTDANNVGSSIHGSSPKTTMADADKVAIIDTEALNVLKTLSWAYVKSILKTYFDSLYAVVSGFTTSGDITLGENTAVVLDPAGSADEKWSGITSTGTAGATLAVGDLVYLDVTAGKWLLADASAATTSGNVPIALCILAANDGGATNLLLIGTMRSAAFPASIALGAPLYISETAGDITATAPTTADSVMRRVGFAVTAEPNTIYFNPSPDFITHV